jgi:hypothetical protein
MERLGGILRSHPMADNQLVEPGSCVMLARERPIWQEHQENLCRRSDRAAIANVATMHATRCIGDRHVQVCAGGTETPRQAQDLQRTRKHGLSGFTRVPNTGLDQAADARNNEG